MEIVSKMPFKSTVFRLVISAVLVLLLAFAGATKPGSGAFLPQLQTTPDPCGIAFARPQNPQINVRGGPGTNYPIIAEAGADELPILGRHHAFSWWQVSLPDNSVGWVSDEVVIVGGYIAGVQLVEAPEINGYVPDLNEEWVPFIEVPCGTTPIPTAVLPGALPTREATVTGTESDDAIWLSPLNLSQSGVAQNPVVVVESAGFGHMIWQEETTSNFLYVREQDGEWSAPIEVELPFSTRRYFPDLREDQATPVFLPQLLIDTTNRIHALWLDADGTLYHSDVASDDFARYDAWSTRQLLAESVVAYDAALDGAARLHVTYLTSRELPDSPAGIYYLRQDSAGISLPELLYSSSYFRAITADQANLQIAAGDGEAANLVYVSWDNRLIDTLFFVSSADGGEQWGEVVVVDRHGPSDLPEAMTPSNIMVATAGDSVLLVWQADHEGTGCRQYYRWSVDSGASWQGQHMLEAFPGCYTHGELLTGDNGRILLLAHWEDETYLLAWNREWWSEPQPQDALTEFVNGETLRPVRFDCYQGQFRDDQLLVAGCSSGEVNDIWVTAREIGSTTAWFAQPVWSQPAPITGVGNAQVSAIELVATGDGLVHAFFSQHQDPGIYYTRWDGVAWSRVTLLFKLPGGEEAGQPVVAVGPGNELLLTVLGSGGSLYFSLAESSDAVVASGWSAPILLPVPQNGRVSPADVAWHRNGTVYIAYSVPLNEERGVYLVHSTDQGNTWSEPLPLFDGAAAGFDLVGPPALLVSADGLLHIQWTRQSLSVEDVSQAVSLYYARSEDAGHSFSEAETVVGTPLAWQEIVADGMGNTHRLWQQPGTLVTVWDMISSNRGQSWQDAQRLSAEWGSTASTVDPSGQLHLVGVGLDSLGHWLWDGSRWQAETPLRWSSALQSADLVDLLATAINKDGKMVVVLARATDTGQVANGLLYSSRTLNLPPAPAPIEQAPTRPASPTPPTPATPSPEPTLAPTAIQPVLESEPTSPQNLMDLFVSNDPVTQFVVAFSPVMLLLLVVLGRMAIRAVRVKPR